MRLDDALKSADFAGFLPWRRTPGLRGPNLPGSLENEPAGGLSVYHLNPFLVF